MGIGRRQVAIAVTIIAAALLFMIFTGMRNTMVFYYTVSEVVAQQNALAGEPLRVAGHVVPGSIERSDAGPLAMQFRIHEGGRELSVLYSGRSVVPDTLVDDAEAVVEGKLQGNGTFRATHVMAKCPSKYEAQEDYAKFRQQGVAARAQARP